MMWRFMVNEYLVYVNINLGCTNVELGHLTLGH